MARGTKTEIRPGVWRLRALSAYDPATGNPRQLSRTVRGGARVAERELARFVAEVEAGDVPMGTDQTVAEFLDSWLAFVEPLRSPTTIRGYRDKARRWKAALGAKKVSKLTAQDLDRTYSRWLEEGAAPQTVQHCHRVLAAALKQAQRWGLISRCVTDLARPPASVHRVAPRVGPGHVAGPGAGSKGEGARHRHGGPAGGRHGCAERGVVRVAVVGPRRGERSAHHRSFNTTWAGQAAPPRRPHQDGAGAAGFSGRSGRRGARPVPRASPVMGGGGPGAIGGGWVYPDARPQRGDADKARHDHQWFCPGRKAGRRQTALPRPPAHERIAADWSRYRRPHRRRPSRSRRRVHHVADLCARVRSPRPPSRRGPRRATPGQAESK